MFLEAKDMFDKADTNGNGHLDETEIAPVIVEMFTAQGKEWVAKYEGAIQKEAKKTIARFDTNGDGKLSFAEFCLMFQSRPFSALLPGFQLPRIGCLYNDAKFYFDKTDKDRDGMLDRHELATVHFG